MVQAITFIHTHPLAYWVIFGGAILAMLGIDLGVSRNKQTPLSIKEALAWSVVWISVAGLFSGFLWKVAGHSKAVEFVTGYVIEKSLSVDNIFVFVILFKTFAIPERFQHKVLFWGIFGAIVMRALFIYLGITALQLFHPLMYIFGAFLIVTGIKMGLSKDKEMNIEDNRLLHLLKRYIKIDYTDSSGQFIVRKGTETWATRMLLALILIEFTDLIFAVDSIPAILAISKDPFIVFSSNIFAILGLRALYFVVTSAIEKFHYLNYALAAILSFVGAKMVISDWIHIPTTVSLAAITLLLGTAMIASAVKSKFQSE
ncbi:TerC family protein [bacterium]|nr:TerC family protein [bacterium]